MERTVNIKAGSILKIHGKLVKVTNVEVQFRGMEIRQVTVQVQGEIDYEFDLETLQRYAADDDKLINYGVLHGHNCDPLPEITL